MERLIHYSAKPLTKLYSTTSQKEPDHSFSKPDGLWVSVEGEGDWREWCESERFGSERLLIENVLRLKADANVLWLRSSHQLYELTKRYGVKSKLSISHPGLFKELCIDWGAVSRDYQGILIAPYQWSCRMDQFTNWYYGWDCASGCIWDVGAIEDEIVSSPITALSGSSKEA